MFEGIFKNLCISNQFRRFAGDVSRWEYVELKNNAETIIFLNCNYDIPHPNLIIFFLNNKNVQRDSLIYVIKRPTILFLAKMSTI